METLDPIKGSPPCYASTATELKDRLNPEEASYLCGLIDADGHIGIDEYQDKVYELTRFTLSVEVRVTHPMIIDLCDTYGGIWYYEEKKTIKTKDGEPVKPIYCWTWNRLMIRLYFPQMLPYFKLKKDQAKIILKALEYFGKRKLPNDAEREILTKYREQLKELHHKPYPLDKSKYEHLRLRNIDANPKCPKCGSKTYKGRKYKTKQGMVRYFKCISCKFRFKVEK